ncbi:Mitochondrial dicarboxylate carrier [Hypsibius exemplaris]|uniref:Mitochondrial dicarboxylate carrier n=1 Tax=Hypsibius exemplaris TaxID=2072580 RepID=A0A9X6NI87_HYPEX|nr:Mitochondrial dicarboxylate carrier [Hypsibius exemplaris]
MAVTASLKLPEALSSVVRLTAEEKEIKKIPRWYFGGMACSTAACCTHPIDMMKVHLQTHTADGKLRIFQSMINLVKARGVRTLYVGLTASVTRESIYSGARFGIYEVLKPDPGTPARPFYMKVVTAAFAGAFGGFIGAPFDLINVRMLSDIKVPVERKRNYRHVVDGFLRICREEGPLQLYNGASMVVLRAICITVGQLSFYDQVKQTLLGWPYFEDTLPTHLLSSAVAACTATTLAMPVDVMKTRMQNAPPGKYKSMASCFMDTAKTGPLSFYKGYFPAFTRVGFHTVITFLTFEQLRIHFGKDTE